MNSRSADPRSCSSRALRVLLLPLSLTLAVAACAPQNTGTTYGAAGLGRAGSVSYGTLVGSRPVQVRGNTGGLGTAAGAVVGGVGGSFIGGDWRSNVLAGLGGALLGGLAGNAVENGVGTGQAIEFIVREDRGGDIAVVQTNEDGLQVGDRVVVNRGDRTRLSRAAGGAAPAAYAPAVGYGAPSYSSPEPGYSAGPVNGMVGAYRAK